MMMMFAQVLRGIIQGIVFLISAAAPVQVVAKTFGDVMAGPDGGGPPFAAITPALLGIAESPTVRGVILVAVIAAAIMGMKARNREIVRSMLTGGLVIYFGPIALRTVADAMAPGTLPPAPEEPAWLWALGFFGVLMSGLYLAFGTPDEMTESGSRGYSSAAVPRRRPPDIPEIGEMPPIESSGGTTTTTEPASNSAPAGPEDDAVVRNKRKIVL